MCTATGEQHGLIQNLPNSVPYDDFKRMDPKHAEDAKKKLKDDKKTVKARYINRRGINERLEKPYCAGPGEPIQIWKFIPEYTYDVPKGLVEEVNASRIPKREGLQSVGGKDVNGGAPLSRDEQEIVHEFVPLSF
jgi:hypothetical protein